MELKENIIGRFVLGLPLALPLQNSAHFPYCSQVSALGSRHSIQIALRVWKGFGLVFKDSLCWNLLKEWNDRAFDVSCDASAAGILRSFKERPEVIVEFVFASLQKTMHHFFAEVRAEIEEFELEEVCLQRFIFR